MILSLIFSPKAFFKAAWWAVRAEGRYEKCDDLRYWRRTLKLLLEGFWLAVGVAWKAVDRSYVGDMCTKLLRNNILDRWMSCLRDSVGADGLDGDFLACATDWRMTSLPLPWPVLVDAVGNTPESLG